MRRNDGAHKLTHGQDKMVTAQSSVLLFLVGSQGESCGGTPLVSATWLPIVKNIIFPYIVVTEMEFC